MKYLVLLSSVLLVSACASMTNHQSQKVTMRTPGAMDARCIIENEDMKYTVETDQTIEIMHSPNDLLVTCKAAGNRERSTVVESHTSGMVVANIFNGIIPGVAYDTIGRGAYKYPEQIVVNFRGVEPQPYPMPEYHNPDVRTALEYNTPEYLGPTVVMSEEERGREPYVLQKKERDFEPVVKSYGLDAIHREHNPHVNASYDPAEEDK